jgi:hypothetical protein
MQAIASSSKSPVYRFSHDGEGDPDLINKELVKILGTPALLQEDTEDHTYYNDYIDDDSYVRIFFNTGRSQRVNLKGMTTSLMIADKIKEVALRLIETKKVSNAVFALMSGNDGLSLRAIGKIEHDIVENNYSKEAIKGYKHIVDCLSSDDPCGRLILLQGPPGTGKSYMIRSLVSSINSTFIVVGSNMIADLSGPAILPVILGCVDDEDKKPITFILEDADIALSHRKNGGVVELSGLLNLGDGLLGELLDIRILATTNAGQLDLDPAIVRPGRMCQRIILKPFSAKDATTLYTSMVKDKPITLRKETTLAEIYRMAREDGWIPKGTDKPKDGQYL